MPESERDTLLVEENPKGFVMLPRTILLARNLSRDAKLLYAVLLHYAWQERRCFPGYRRLCHDMGASENMVRKYMRELESLGLLTQQRRGQGRTNIYRLPTIRTSRIEVLEPHNTDAPEPQPADVEIETEIEPEGEISIRASEPGYDAEDLETIRRYVEDFRREFRDRASLAASASRAVHLYLASGLSLGDFLAKMQTARQATKATANVRGRMAYWFACLEG